MSKYDDWRKLVHDNPSVLHGAMELLVQVDIAESLSIICAHLDNMRNPNRSG